MQASLTKMPEGFAFGAAFRSRPEAPALHSMRTPTRLRDLPNRIERHIARARRSRREWVLSRYLAASDQLEQDRNYGDHQQSMYQSRSAVNEYAQQPADHQDDGDDVKQVSHIGCFFVFNRSYAKAVSKMIHQAGRVLVKGSGEQPRHELRILFPTSSEGVSTTLYFRHLVNQAHTVRALWVNRYMNDTNSRWDQAGHGT